MGLANIVVMTTYGWGPQDLTEPGRNRKELAEVEASHGVVLEDNQTGWVGAVVRVEKSGGLHVMSLEDRNGKTRTFRLGYGFLLDGEPVRVVAPQSHGVGGTVQRTASGSVKVAATRARTARASRIWVEGKHDAELVEKVWGEDLRHEGIVVEPLHGIDDLRGAIRDFGPGPERRLGILVDHLVPGSKESRIAEDAMSLPGARSNVLIVGHPYVDVWQAIQPRVLGLSQWPEVPRGEDFKTGILTRIGWPHAGKADVGQGWRRMLGAVSSYADLEPSLLGRVEEVIDFLTA